MSNRSVREGSFILQQDLSFPTHAGVFFFFHPLLFLNVQRGSQNSALGVI